MSAMIPRPLPFPGKAVAYIQREVLTLPNAVTLLRLLCAAEIFFYRTNFRLVFWLALIGALSDILDGWLAKTFGWGTAFGKTLDQWVDWFFGIMLMFAIFVAGGVVWSDWPYNGWLLVLIGGYLLLRLKYPRIETTSIAKIKTAMQFAGGVVILAGHAHVPELFLEKDGYDVFLVTGGYLLVWTSLGLMFLSGWEYRKQAKSL